MATARIKKHITETKRQARLVRGCIKRREGRTSIIKDTGGKLLATGQALSGMFVGDEVMKARLPFMRLKRWKSPPTRS